MPPKKKEKENDSSNARPPVQYQADHELFLNAFEKPTQIYRFLRTRNLISPVFLNRTLTYMKERMSRNHKARKDFKVNSLLAKVKAKCESSDPNGDRRYLTLTFLGFFDRAGTSPDQIVKVETSVSKVSHKRRKDSASPSIKLFVATTEVQVNPPEDDPPAKVPVISIPSDSFSISNGNLIKSYILYLKVTQLKSTRQIAGTEEAGPVEPTTKRLKKEDAKYFGADLTIYDRHNRCQLMTGDYELGMQEIQASSKHSPQKGSHWVTLENAGGEPFDFFNKGPLLKFRLEWTALPNHGLIDRPLPFELLNGNAETNGNKENKPDQTDEKSADKGKGKEEPKNKEEQINKEEPKNKEEQKNKEEPKGKEEQENKEEPKNKEEQKNNEEEKNKEEEKKAKEEQKNKEEEKKEKPRIIYQFLYNNNSRQQTEACDDLMCPWCSLNCITLYSLLKHLNLCHSRFTFTYNQIPEGARIDVALNECYDGSYTGSPHDLVSQPPGFAFSRNGPVRRTSVTNVLVCRPKRSPPSLSEFLECEDNDFDKQQRPYITGHNRLYHHTTTCLPVYPKEMDVDSEGENDPKWLQQKTIMMIDDFTDVNEGEKELMKMWNLHVMKHGYVGDCQIPLACFMFIKSKADEIVRKNLYRNFVLHVCNLFDFGLISSQTVYLIIRQLQEVIKRNPEYVAIMIKNWREQRAAWSASGGDNRQRTGTWRRAPDADAHKGASKGSSKSQSKGASKGASKGSPKGALKVASKDASKAPPKEPSKVASKNASKSSPKSSPKEPAKVASKNASKNSPKSSPKEATKDAPKAAPQEPSCTPSCSRAADSGHHAKQQKPVLDVEHS